ncbi:Tail protein [Ferriphaselus amnicola]|uniref:Tail protein n=1 Tax=Ferriphaselus amnicola TaxID=1188319 RepID=A0A2Z6GCB5_9PROT|nr:phage tail assembly protein [Ferriphaselus amnicola]BBE51148.1 Tail protein [Ferriphaselus amnicola]
MKTIILEQPIARGDTPITTLDLRKPNAGELRGLNLTDLLQMDVAALQRVLPRITSPALTEHDVAQMDPADLMQCGSVVAGFLLPKAVLQTVSQPV